MEWFVDLQHAKHLIENWCHDTQHVQAALQPEQLLPAMWAHNHSHSLLFKRG